MSDRHLRLLRAVAKRRRHDAARRDEITPSLASRSEMGERDRAADRASEQVIEAEARRR